MIGIRLGQFPSLIMHLHALSHEVQFSWYSISQEGIDYLIRSIPRRVEEYIKRDLDLLFKFTGGE